MTARAKTSLAFRAALALGLAAALWPLLAPETGGGLMPRSFERLPVLEGGRVKPLDTFARNSLLVIRGTQSLPDAGGNMPAWRWLAEAMFKPEAADTRAIFVIDDPDILGLLGLEPGKTRRFAYWQIQPKREEIGRQAQNADAIEASKRTRFQSAIVDLARKLDLYERVKNTIMVSGSSDPAADLELFSEVLPGALRAAHGGGRATPKDRSAMKVLAQLLERYKFLADAAAFKCLPPLPGEPNDHWTSFGERMLTPTSGEPHPGLAGWAMTARAYRAGDGAAARAALDEYSAWLALARPDDVRRAEQEVLFNRAQPFVSGMALYIAVLLAVFAWWATRREAARQAAYGLLAAALIVHTAGLLARIWLQGRPPVTNLYSSAVFVGWAAALLGAAAERVHRRGFAAVGGALLGFCTLLIAQHLSASGDTMEMMRAVLDSNFWLGTHVVTVTIGYASTFLAGALGVVWVLRRQLLEKPDPEATRALVSLTYGVIAFSVLFSFVGTTLGGIWADQSWGRFWGWDPKENGALLIVLWNALILHARWAGYARERGVMVMAVFGNVVTALSWFGVNMLGIGLHSYGFMDKAFYWLSSFCALQLALMVLGLLPPRARETHARP